MTVKMAAKMVLGSADEGVGTRAALVQARVPSYRPALVRPTAR